MGKTLKLGGALSYPITITKIFKNVGDDISRKESLLQYSYKFKRIISQEFEQDRVDIETGYAEWDSPAEGRILKWRVKVGEVIESDQQLITIEEACSHEVQYAGLCAICGKDMKEANYATAQLDSDRATVNMIHDNTHLTVSADQAIRAEMTLMKRLLQDRKLSLVVDLDQTVIHACIEPTVGEWQRDPSNPNYESVKDVRSFQLDDGPRGLASGCWYYIKMRPGLTEFLENVAELFELHVYTMGTRAYALNIAKIIDPTQKLFGNRVISRDENGSMVAKSLQRLFPVSTNMVVVIDDRADVWPHNRSNLIKVTPYDFFKGIGDINSSFLPKREDILAPTPLPEITPKLPPTFAHSQTSESTKSNTADHDKVPAVSSDETIILQLQAEEQERTLEKQLVDRPLLHLQKQLDKEDEAAVKEAAAEHKDEALPIANGLVENHSLARHNILRDDDQELVHLERHLTSLHQSFFEQFDARATNRRGDDIAPDLIPDAGKILNFLKSRVLRGTKIVLSGLVPLGADVRRTEIGLQAESFGTEIRTRIASDVTHLVISSSRPRTQKVQQAARIPSIKIVNQDWLADCIAQWKKLDERPYLIDVHPSDRAATARASISSANGTTPPPIQPKLAAYQSGQQMFEDEQGEDADDDEDEEEDGDAGFDEDDRVDDQDLSDVMPAELEDGEKSPGAIKKSTWADMSKELEDELGSELDDSDLESVDRGFDTDDDSSKKRKHDDEADEESLLAKKQRLAKTRTTGLRNVHNAGEDDGESNGLPTPGGTGDDDEVSAIAGEADFSRKESVATTQSLFDDDDDDDIDGLEAELEAELAAAMDEE